MSGDRMNLGTKNRFATLEQTMKENPSLSNLNLGPTENSPVTECPWDQDEPKGRLLQQLTNRIEVTHFKVGLSHLLNEKQQQRGNHQSKY